jgi:hypothetical protein
MILLPPYVAASLWILTAGTLDVDLDSTPPQLARRDVVQPYITRATECVLRSVASDPRSKNTSDFSVLIVDSMHSCGDAVREMIDTYDEYYGDGSGEAFFSGPYLEVLPQAVRKWVTSGRQ